MEAVQSKTQLQGSMTVQSAVAAAKMVLPPTGKYMFRLRCTHVFSAAVQQCIGIFAADTVYRAVGRICIQLSMYKASERE